MNRIDQVWVRPTTGEAITEDCNAVSKIGKVMT